VSRRLPRQITGAPRILHGCWRALDLRWKPVGRAMYLVSLDPFGLTDQAASGSHMAEEMCIG
jgi:hypothetical protein